MWFIPLFTGFQLVSAVQGGWNIHSGSPNVHGCSVAAVPRRLASVLPCGGADLIMASNLGSKMLIHSRLFHIAFWRLLEEPEEPEL